MKQCTCCHRTLPLSDFYPRKRGGTDAICKTCALNRRIVHRLRAAIDRLIDRVDTYRRRINWIKSHPGVWRTRPDHEAREARELIECMRSAHESAELEIQT